MFNATKDAMASRAALTWANKMIGRYGSVQDLKIDSAHKTVEVCCQLDGEISPITVKILHYVLETDGDKKFIRGTGFTCTRPWLQNFLADFGPRRRIELPPWAVAIL